MLMKKLAAVISASVIAAGLAGCYKKSDGEQALDDRAQAAAGEMGEKVQWPAIKSAITKDPKIEAEVAAILATMTLEQKVGQMLQPEIKSITPEQVKQYHIGSVLNGGGSIAGKNGYATLDEWVKAADAYYFASMDDSDGGIAIPIIWGTDSMHGASNIIGATIFPHNIGLGAANNPQLLHDIGHVTAIETLTSGVDWLFAPTVAVVRDDRWGRTYEAYSEDPEIVAKYAREMVMGIQGKAGTDSLFADDRMLANVKHFIGDGGTVGGDDQGDNIATEKELRDIHGPGYFSALEAGGQVVMASFNSWHGKKVHGQKYLLTDVLKDQMGFDGLLVSDWNAHGQVAGCDNTSCPQSINAGIDMVMVPDDWQGLYYNMIESVKSGEIPMARIDDAVTRILRVKKRMGLFERPEPSKRVYSNRSELLGSKAHRQLARKAVRESLVLLKNQDNLLPLSPKQKVMVVGAAADDIGQAAGGWTVTWQGVTNANEQFPGGTSIYQGIQSAVSQAGGQAWLSVDGNTREKPDVAIMVFGEKPYAEMQGDLLTIEYQAGFQSDLQVLKKLQAQNIPVISVFLSGRPFWMNREINASDAFVAAWLPGSEGAGVADVLFTDANGQMQHDFKGRLTFSWPKKASQTVLNVHDESYDPLFAYGYGLSYQDRDVNLGVLSEESDTQSTSSELPPVELFVGRPVAPWQLVMTNGRDLESLRSLLPKQIPHLKSQTMDKDIQGDTRLLTWAGTGQAQLSLKAGSAFDLSAYSESALVMDVNIKTMPTAEVLLTSLCGKDCQGSVKLTTWLKKQPKDTWLSLSVDSACLQKAGADFKRVTSPMTLQTQGQLSIAVANIRIQPNKKDNLSFSCS